MGDLVGYKEITNIINIENIEKMAEKRGTGMFVYEEKLYFCN